MPNLDTDTLLNALRSVYDPDLKRDLVSLNMIRDVKVGANGEVSCRVVLTTPACPVKAKLQKECEEALLAVPGVTQAKVTMDAEVRAKKTGVNAIAGVTHIIAVSSGKGGVGKSTVAVNLAVSLALEGASVGLMDADVYGPNVPTMMGVTEGPRIEETAERGEVFLPPSAHGVKVMSMGFLIQGDQPLVWRGPMLHSVINQFCHKVDWGKLDYLVVDMPPGTGDVQLSLAQLVPVTGAVLVSTPQEVSLQDVRKAFHMFEKVRIPIMGVVENMSFFRCDHCDQKHALFGEGGGALLAKKFQVDLLSQIPIVKSVREGGDFGKPIVLSQPDSEVAKEFRSLARTIAQKVSILAHEAAHPSQVVQIGRFN